jgi:hypothetical protein
VFGGVLGAVGCGDNLEPPPVVDTSGPPIALQHQPADPSNERTPAFAFGSTDTSATFQCQIDGIAAFAPCASPFTAPALGDGPHTFRLRATDPADNATELSYGWTVDTIAPSVTITAGPSGATGTATPAFEFTVSPDAAVVECAVDGAAFAPCVSPATTSPLDPGAHSFTVRATDTAGNAATAALEFVLGVCGDGTAQGTEQCDGADLRGQSCAGHGAFTAGALACTSTCSFDTTACTTCGNGIVEPGEDCDGPELGGATCGTLGFDSGALGCTASCTIDSRGCGTCGDGVVNGSEPCDGADLNGATCESLGHAPGPLACSPTCDAIDAGGCDGGFTADNTGFDGKVCLDGVKFSSFQTPLVAVCTEDAGVWRLGLQPGGPETWTNMDGVATANTVPVTNLHGRAVIPGLDNPSTAFLVDNSDGTNSYRSNLFGSSMQPPPPMSWPSHVEFARDGIPIELFSAKTGSSANNALGGWHPTLGAVILHGNAASTATQSSVGPMVTGTVTSITAGTFSLPSTDINIAVFGKTPAGAPATGGGIYWTCDQIGALGGSYIEHDTGIPDDDKPLVALLLPDPASFSSTARMCPATGGLVGGFAATYYAALRGGGQLYKTTDGGEHWAKRNIGLPAGAEVYSLASDCQRVVSGFPNLCNNHDLLYAATSLGLYRSTNAGASWTLAGLEGKSVRGVTLVNDHPTGTAPRVIVGVDDAIKIYQKAP